MLRAHEPIREKQGVALHQGKTSEPTSNNRGVRFAALRFVAMYDEAVPPYVDNPPIPPERA